MASENSRFSSLLAASPAVRSEEKQRLFLQAISVPSGEEPGKAAVFAGCYYK